MANGKHRTTNERPSSSVLLRYRNSLFAIPPILPASTHLEPDGYDAGGR